MIRDHVRSRSKDALWRSMCSGIQPVRTWRSMAEFEPRKSYPPMSFMYAFSMNEGQSCFFAPVDIPTSLLLESKRRRLSMTMRRKSPLTRTFNSYLPSLEEDKEERSKFDLKRRLC